MIETYKSSNRFNSSVFGYATIGAVALAAVGLLYQLAMDWIPLIYLNLLVAIAMGIANGAAVTAVIHRSKCRCASIALPLAILVGTAPLLSSHYMSYRLWCNEVADSLTASEHLDPAQREKLVEGLTPGLYLESRAKSGWAVGHSSSSALKITGVMFYITWAIEALILLGGAVIGARSALEVPFCEHCDTWASKNVHIRSIFMPDAKAGDSLRLVNSVDELMKAHPGSVKEATEHQLHYRLARCPKCSMTATINIEAETKTINKKGQVESKKKSLWKNVKLSATQLDTLEREAAARQPTPAPSSAPESPEANRFSAPQSDLSSAGPQA